MKSYLVTGLFIIFISFTACSKENSSNKTENDSNVLSNNIIWTTADSSYKSITLYEE